jgi:predicted dehydrogenase
MVLPVDALPAGRRVRYAVVGLGYFAQAAVLPAFEHARERSELAAIVSGDEAKRRELAKRFNVPRSYSYDQYDDCLRSGEIDAVYICLPNDMHRNAAVQAARAGIHVLCEKPMALTEAECLEMIREAEAHAVKLMVAYRLHFERANLEAIDVLRSSKIGEPRFFHSINSMQVQPPNIRLERARGGGPLYDIGIYCINAARYLFGDEPVEVSAFKENNGEARFSDVPEMVSGLLRFPRHRLATFTCSFGGGDLSSYRVVGSGGDLRVEPAFEYAQGLTRHLTIDGQTQVVHAEKRDQVAAEIAYFSDCVLSGREPEPNGWEGLADVRIIRALWESIESHAAVLLPEFDRDRRPTLAQEISKPPVEKPDLLHARPPSGT